MLIIFRHYRPPVKDNGIRRKPYLGARAKAHTL
jgi:hypothetical protein